ncbi:MAG: hypothetical protein KDI88_00860 [Gammaproteobacteria bacterium]|nr:hypothetical protein [Gammaproteobacteria bacterium]
MNNVTDQYQNMPEQVAAINQSGSVTWSDEGDLSTDFKQQFDAERIPVLGVRHVRVWGLQVDDERELPGHERTSVEDEDLWEIILEAKDGSRCEVNSKFVVATGVRG